MTEPKGSVGGFVDAFLQLIARLIMSVGAGGMAILATALGFAAFASWAFRLYLLLKDDLWLGSLCEFSLNVDIKFELPPLCDEIRTGWAGVDRMGGWLLREADMSMALLGGAILSLVVAGLVAWLAVSIHPASAEGL